MIATVEAFNLDGSLNEFFATQKSDMPATTDHRLIGIRGLEIGTLIAAINEGILHKAICTTNFNKPTVRKGCIAASKVTKKGQLI